MTHRRSFDLVGNSHQKMHLAAFLAYGVEAAFLLHMTASHVASHDGEAADAAEVFRLLGSVAAW